MDYDVCIIGGGPAGYLAGIRASQLGARACVIEKDLLGGVCTNRGCIPSKALLEVANPILAASKWSEMGFSIEQSRIDFPMIMSRMNGVVSYVRAGIKALLDSNRVEVVNAGAEFIDRYTIKINGTQTITSKYILIATGSVPAFPDIPGIELEGVSSSDGLFALKEIPKRAGIIGAGAIGIEFATILKSLGSEVTVLEYMDRPVPLMHPDISTFIESLMRGMAVNLYTSSRVTGITASGSSLKIEFAGQLGAKDSTSVDRVFVVTGRKSGTKGIGIEDIGISTTNGWIDVNMAMRTSVENIYAAGDVNGIRLLAHAAFHQGIIAVENMFGMNGIYEPELVPSVVYSNPPVAQVGMDEPALNKKGVEYKIGVFELSNSPMAIVHGEPSGFVKLIADKKYGTILGAVCAGEYAYELLPVFTAGIAGEITVDELRRAVYAHPSLSEAIGESAWAVDKLSMHTVKRSGS